MKVTIISDDLGDVRVINSATGEAIENIQRIQFAYEKGKIPSALIHVLCPEVDLSPIPSKFKGLEESSINGTF